MEIMKMIEYVNQYEAMYVLALTKTEFYETFPRSIKNKKKILEI